MAEVTVMHSVITNATGSTAMGKGVDDMTKSREGRGSGQKTIAGK